MFRNISPISDVLKKGLESQRKMDILSDQYKMVLQKVNIKYIRYVIESYKQNHEKKRYYNYEFWRYLSEKIA